jgi:hypothetical protein
MPLLKIISGGQTGVDRGALDAALAVHFPCGGRCPAGRRAEDGTVPEKYPMTALPGAGYRERTRKNVEDSDGTVILAPGELTGGTALTLTFCRQLGKPYLTIDASDVREEEAAEAVLRFVEAHRIAVLNVAGPRASGWREGSDYAERVIRELFKRGADRQGA